MKAASASAITLSQLPAGELCDSFMEKWVWYRFSRSKARRMRCKGDGSCPNAMTHAARTREASRKAAGADGVRDGTVEAARIQRPPSPENGRTSCRERGC